MKYKKIRLRHIAILMSIAICIVALCAIMQQHSGINKDIAQYENTELTSLIVAYDNSGNKIAAEKLDEDMYSGYTFRIKNNTPKEYISDDIISASGIKDIGGDNLYSAASLDDIDKFIPEKYIEYIEPDYTVTVSDSYYTEENVADPNDVSDKQWNIDMMKVRDAWKQGVYGQPMYDRQSRVTVAVIDSGLYGTGTEDTIKHEDINYDRVKEGKNLANSSKGTPDTLGHGTFVSGMIFAEMNNNVGIAGIAPEVDILPVKVFGSAGRTTNSTVESAIYEAIDKKVDVINMSLGSEGYSQSLATACDAAEDAGILVIAAAGNDGKNVSNYPAAYDNVVGVASVDYDEETSYFSQYGKSVYVAAPGGSVYSLGLGEKLYETGSGTSYASPEVAALAAMVKSIIPEMNQSGFMELLKETSQDKGDPGFDDYYGWGIVDFGNAIRNVLEQKYLPVYNISFDITDEEGTYIDDAVVEVKAAEDISWEDDTKNNIKAGTWKKGTVIKAKDGIYELHKGEYSYTVSREGYRTIKESFTTYMKDQSIKAVLEKTYSVSIQPEDSQGNIPDDAKIKLTRTGDGLEIGILQNDKGEYNAKMPAGIYEYIAEAEGYVQQHGTAEIKRAEGQSLNIILYERDELCNVTFRCSSDSGEQIKDAIIDISDTTGENQPIVCDDGTYMLVKGKTYICMVSRAGYEENMMTLKAPQEDTFSVNVVLTEVECTAEFVMKDSSGNILSDAVVAIKDSNGSKIEPFKISSLKYNLDVKGNYSYTASCNGYADKTGSFKADKSRVITIVLEPEKRAVSFEFKDEDGNNLNDVSAAVYDKEGILYRKASENYLLPEGLYTCSVAKEGYAASNIGFEVSENTSVVEIILSKAAGSESEFAGGSGTEEDPYLIVTEQQLKALAQKTALDNSETVTEGYYRLLSDITISGEWQPIGNYESENNYNIFKGGFDGGGYTITVSNVKSKGICTSLFGAVEGVKIRNVTVEGRIKGEKYTGGIAGLVFYNTDSTIIENCENKATVAGSAFAGGIAGYISAAANAKVNVYINSCSNAGKITVTENCAGGIIGAGRAVKITSSKNLSDIKGAYDVGGISGSVSANTYTYSCYNTGNITQTVISGANFGKRGAIAGSSSGNYRGVYYLKGTANAAIGSSSGVSMDYYDRLGENEMKQTELVELLNLKNEEDYGDFVYSQGEFPLLRWQKPETAAIYAQQPDIIQQPQSMSCTTGDSICLTVDASTDDNGVLSYEWYVSNTQDGKYAQKISGAESTQYKPDTTGEGTLYYYALVTNTVTENGKTVTNRAKSNCAEIKVTAENYTKAPVITATSGAGSFEIGDEAVMVVEATGENLSYQWYKSKYEKTKGSAVSGQTATECTADTHTSGIWYYYAAVTNTSAAGSKTVNSERIRIEVKAKETPVIPPSGGGGGAGAIVPPTEDEEEPVVIEIEPAIGENIAQADVTSEKLQNAVQKFTQKSKDLKIEVIDKNKIDNTEISIDLDNAIELAKKLDGDLIIKTGLAKITLSKEAFNEIIRQADKEAEKITITVMKTIVEVKGKSNEFVQLRVKSGNNIIYNFDGKVLVESDMVAVYADAQDVLQLITDEFSDVNSIKNPALDRLSKADVKELVKAMRIKASSVRTAKGNIRIKANADIKTITDAGYTVRYKYYRSVKKTSGYKALKTKNSNTYTNTTGKKGTRYYYKVRVYVYDGDNPIGSTELKQSTAASRKK